MSSFNTKALPNSFRKCIAPEQRTTKELQTQEDADKAFEARSHKKLQIQVTQYLYLIGVRYIEGATFGKKTRINRGAPDIRFVFAGKPYAFEFKVGADKQSDEQKDVQARMAADGWNFYVIRSLDEVKWIMKGEK